MTAERTAFEAAIQESPRDWTTRKVYADWLEEHGEDDLALHHRGWNDEKQDALEWMEWFAKEKLELSYQEALDAASNFARHGRYHTDAGSCGFSGQEAMSYPQYRSKYWEFWSLLTGQPVPGDIDEDPADTAPFACAC